MEFDTDVCEVVLGEVGRRGVLGKGWLKKDELEFIEAVERRL